MTKTLIILSILIITSTISFAQSNYDRYLSQGISFYKKKDYLTALVRFDLAYELARTSTKKKESRDWKNKSKEGIKKQAKDLKDASRLRMEAYMMKNEAENQKRMADEQKQFAIKQQALARLKEFELSNTLKAVYFYDGKYGLAKKDSLFGFIDREGEVKIEHIYQQAGSFDQSGFAKVKRDNAYYLIDTVGTEYLLAVNLKNINQNTQAVDLRGWKLTKFPRQLLKHSQIKIILLGDNQLSSLPGKITKLEKLKVLELTGNQCSEAEIGNAKELLPGCSVIY